MKSTPVFLAAVLMAVPAYLSADVATFYADQDAHVWSYQPNGNWGSSTNLTIGYVDGFSNALIEFDLSSLAGSTITSATLNMYIWQSAGSMPTNNIFIARNDEDWSESTVTYNNRPAFSGSSGIDAPANLGWWYVDVADFIQEFADGTYTNYGFQIYKANIVADAFYVCSSENANHNPVLIVHYTPMSLSNSTFGAIKAMFGQQ